MMTFLKKLSSGSSHWYRPAHRPSITEYDTAQISARMKQQFGDLRAELAVNARSLLHAAELNDKIKTIAKFTKLPLDLIGAKTVEPF